MAPIKPGWRRLCVLCLVVMIGAIFIGGEQPGAGGLFPPPWDKVVHVIAFGVIGVLVALAFPSKSLPAILLVVLCIGAADEIHQLYLPGRQPGLDDLLADLIGGLIILPLIARLRFRYSPASP